MNVLRFGRVTALVTALSLTACQGLQNIPNDISNIVSDVRSGIPEAELLLSIVSDAGNLILGPSNTSPGAVKFRSAVDSAKLALIALARFSNGADDATQGQLDAARDEFVAAWKALMGAAREIGILSGGKLSVKRGSSVERVQIVTPRLAQPRE